MNLRRIIAGSVLGALLFLTAPAGAFFGLIIGAIVGGITGSTIVGAIVGGIVSAALQRRAAKKAAAKANQPDGLSAQRAFIQEPNMPRQICYGEAWLAPKIIYSGNGHGSDGEYRASKPRGYFLLTAIAEHDVEILDVRVNGDDFFTKDELKKFNGEPFVVDGTANDDHFDKTKRNPDGKITYSRERAQDIRENSGKDVSEASLDYLMMFFPKRRATWSTSNLLHSYVFGAKDKQANPGKYPSSKNLPTLTGFAAIFHALLTQANVIVRAGTDLPPPPSAEALVHKLRYVTPPRGFSSWTATHMHCYGTSTLGIYLPIVESKVKEPIWARHPDLLLKVKRRGYTLRKWTDSEVLDMIYPDKATQAELAATLPKYDSTWREDNAALCAFDYLSRYTDYNNPCGGYYRIDIASVAHAAKVCHEKGYKCNGSVTLGNASYDVLYHFEQAMGGGLFVERAGIIYMYAGESQKPVRVITDNEVLLDSWTIVPIQDRGARRGLTDTAYTDGNGERQGVAFNHSHAEENLKIHQQDLVFVNNASQARHVSFVINSRAWDTSSIVFTLAPGAEMPLIHEMVTVNLENIGVKGDFRIATVETHADGSFEVTANTERDDLFDVKAWGGTKDANDYIPPPTPPLGVVDVDPHNIIVSRPGGTDDFLAYGREYTTAPADTTNVPFYVEYSQGGALVTGPPVPPPAVGASASMPATPIPGAYIRITATFVHDNTWMNAGKVYQYQGDLGPYGNRRGWRPVMDYKVRYYAADGTISVY